MVSDKKVDLAIVVMSCDKYADLWRPYFELFFRFWPEIKYPVYLAANQVTFDGDERVTTLLSGEDKDWSSSLRSVVEQINAERIMFLFEDIFWDKAIDDEKISELINWSIKNDVSFLSLVPNPEPGGKKMGDVGVFGKSELYKTSLQASVVKKEVILDLLIDGENPWQFEHNSIARSDKYDDMYGVYKFYIPRIHGVERGKWYRSAVHRLEKLNCTIDHSKRPTMSVKENLVFCIDSMRGRILKLFPIRWRAGILKKVQTLYKILSLR